MWSVSLPLPAAICRMRLNRYRITNEIISSWLMQRDVILDLAVVIPVYNEELAIAGVLRDWSAVLDSLGMKYVIAEYNDGSQDRTKEVLAETEIALKGKILVVNKENSGHGPTILQGYKEYAPKSDWIFQIDSDNEMQPDGFAELWRARGEYDFLLGYRGGAYPAAFQKDCECSIQDDGKALLWQNCLGRQFSLSLDEIFCFRPCFFANTRWHVCTKRDYLWMGGQEGASPCPVPHSAYKPQDR